MTIDDPFELDMQESIAWIITMSIGLMILGILSMLLIRIASPFFTSMVGIITLISGIVMVIESFQSAPVRGLWLNLIVGCFYIVASIYMLFNVETAGQALRLGFGVLFMAEGIFTVSMAVINRAGYPASWLVSLNGITTLVLGIFILNHWPSSALWLIGVYVGVSLLGSGTALLVAAIARRRIQVS